MGECRGRHYKNRGPWWEASWLLKGVNKTSGKQWEFVSVAILEILWPVNSGIADPHDTLIRVQRRIYKTAMGGLWVTNIRSILGMAHLVPYGEGKWLVNNRIDLKTWNDVYMGLGDVIE